MCSECAGSCIRVIDHSIEVHDDGLGMPARCESLIAIRSRDSRSVMRCYRDVQLTGMGSKVRSGCSPPTLCESGAIAATYPLTASVSLTLAFAPRPRHKEKVNAHHELAIFRCLFPATPSCTPASSSLFLYPFTIWVFLPGGLSFVFLCLYQHLSKARVLSVVSGLPSLVRMRL